MAKFSNLLNSLDENIQNRLGSLDQQVGAGTVKAPHFPLKQVSLGGVTSQPLDSNSEELETGEAELQDLTQTASHRIQCDSGDIWVSGNALLCSCPDCNAPMTIRTWLGFADCWRCPASIALTEEQFRAARQLELQTAKPRQLEQRITPQPQPQIAEHPLEDFAAPAPTTPLADARQRELERLARGSMAARWIRSGFRLTPAWIVSLVLHLIIILLLALIVMSDRSIFDESITLSTFLSSEDSAGGQITIQSPEDMLQDDLLMNNQLQMADRELRKVLQKANQDARQLQVDPEPRVPLPDLARVKENITTRTGKLMSFASRDPRVRSEMVRKEGGTTVTEAAVARGLRWLASVQNKDGGWSLQYYERHQDPSNESDLMGTSLALLPLLGAGQTHEFGTYKNNVASGLAWMINHQKSNGDLRQGSEGNAGMYAHGQATIVLCEALAITGDEKLREPAQRAVSFIEAAQHRKGGWRYQPGQAGDTSIFGWQMMALQSARAPDLNLELDDSTLKLADYFLEQVTADARFDNRRRTRLPKGSAYCYLPGRDATPAMTAEAILCRMYLGWTKDDPRLSSAVNWLVQDHLPSARNPNLYYWYYGTQVMHHYGGKPWQLWNEKMRGLLISSQRTRGRHPGSWDPDSFEWGSRGGRIYTTSLAVCTLEVYYRHLPIFKQIELTE